MKQKKKLGFICLVFGLSLGFLTGTDLIDLGAYCKEDCCHEHWVKVCYKDGQRYLYPIVTGIYMRIINESAYEWCQIEVIGGLCPPPECYPYNEFVQFFVAAPIIMIGLWYTTNLSEQEVKKDEE